MSIMTENKYQSKLIKRLKAIFTDCIIIKNDANYIQGFPDITIFYEGKYACLEVKESASAPHRPNQDFYISKLGEKGYAKFIYPENEEDIINELCVYFTF